MIGKVFRWLGRRFLNICTGLGAIIVLGVLVFFAMTRFKSPPPLPEKTVLALSLDGPFIEGVPSNPLQMLLEGGAQSFYKLLTTLQKAERDPKILGLYVNTGTPSLEMAQIQELRDAFISFRKAGKFIYFYTPTFGEMTPAPSFHYLATAADVIGIQPLGSVGLTGLGAEMPFLKKIMDSTGVKADFIRHGKYKSYTETFTEEKMSPAFRESLEGILASLSQQVAWGVAKGRNISVERTQELMRNGPFSDKEALKAGLVDRLTYEQIFEKEALAKAGEKAELVSFSTYEKITFSSEKKSTPPQIALVFAQGDIVPDREKNRRDFLTFSSQDEIGDSSTLKLFSEIEENPDIKAVVYRINSGGGHALASDAIGEGLRKLREAGKKVVISMGNTTASGGYWIALGADEIVANPGTITGSIGAFWGKFVLSNLWEKLGVYWDHAETAENARLASMNAPFSPEIRDKVQKWVDDLYTVFVERTAQGRRMSLSEAENLAQGRVWTGEQAQKQKLVDYLGGIFTALERARVLASLPENVAIGIFPAPKSLWELLALSLLGGAGDGPGSFAILGVMVKKELQTCLSLFFKGSESKAQLYTTPLQIR